MGDLEAEERAREEGGEAGEGEEEGGRGKHTLGRAHRKGHLPYGRYLAEATPW